MWRGNVGSRSNPSTPAHSEWISRTLGSLASSPAVGLATSTQSISAASPTSGKTRRVSSGSAARNAVSHSASSSTWARNRSATRHTSGLSIEPDVFHAPAVVDAIGHQGDAFDLGPPAAGVATEIQHRAHDVLLQPPVDLPDQALALLLVGLHRLLVDQLVDLLVAVVHVGARAADVA